MTFSQNLLDNSQPQTVSAISQPYRSQNQNIMYQQQSLNYQGRSNFFQNRVPVSRLNATPERTNVNVAKTLKQLQNRLEDYPVIVSTMLEEGIDFVEKAKVDKSEEEFNIVTNLIEMLKTKIKEKDEKIKNFMPMIIGEFNSMSMTLEKVKGDKDKYSHLIDTLQLIIDKQRKIIDQLKLEVSSFKTATKTIKVKNMDKLVDDSNISSRQVIRDTGYSIPEDDDFISRRTPRSILKPILTPSSSESMRMFSLDDIIAVSDEEDDDPEQEAIHMATVLG